MNKPNPPWRPGSELTPDFVQVLAFYTTSLGYFIITYQPHAKVWRDASGHPVSRLPDFWMPIPPVEPPKKKYKVFIVRYKLSDKLYASEPIEQSVSFETIYSKDRYDYITTLTFEA